MASPETIRHTVRPVNWREVGFGGYWVYLGAWMALATVMVPETLGALALPLLLLAPLFVVNGLWRVWQSRRSTIELGPSRVGWMRVGPEDELLLVHDVSNGALYLSLSWTVPLGDWWVADQEQAIRIAERVASIVGLPVTHLEVDLSRPEDRELLDARFVAISRRLFADYYPELEGIEPLRPPEVVDAIDGFSWPRADSGLTLDPVRLTWRKQQWCWSDLVNVMFVVQRKKGTIELWVWTRRDHHMVREEPMPRDYQGQKDKVAHYLWVEDQLRQRIERCRVPTGPTERESTAIESLQGLRQRATPTAGSCAS